MSLRPQEDRSRGELANVLAVGALCAMFIAYVTAFTILGDTNYASKFENGELPAGVDAAGGQTAAVASLVWFVVAWVLMGVALASRRTKTAGVVVALVFLATFPYALMELVAWQLAF